MRRLRQPAVLGELVAGVALGPTVLGALLPGVASAIFPAIPEITQARDALTRLGMVVFLFVAGLETRLSDVGRLKREAVSIGLSGSLVPLASGFVLVQALPAGFWGPQAALHPVAFSLFVGVNLANSAIPVLARILMDVGVFSTRVGTLCMSAVVVDDLLTWACFAVILADLSPSGAAAASLPATFATALAVLASALVLGRWWGPPVLAWLRRQLPVSAAFTAATAALLLAAAAASEAIGTHAALGAFLLGAALGGGDAEHLEAQGAISRFALGFFAPLYFVSLGLTTDFARSFDPALVLTILAAAIVSKVAGVLLGARLAGLPRDREAWAVAFGLNARGATGIILAAIGHRAGVVDDRVFVALAVMAFATSLLAGPLMKRLLPPGPATS